MKIIFNNGKDLILGEGNGNPLQYSCLENPMDRGAWWAAVHWVAQNRTLLNYLVCMHALEKEMAIHSSILAQRITGTEESGGLPSMGSCRVRQTEVIQQQWWQRRRQQQDLILILFPSPINFSRQFLICNITDLG